MGIYPAVTNAVCVKTALMIGAMNAKCAASAPFLPAALVNAATALWIIQPAPAAADFAANV